MGNILTQTNNNTYTIDPVTGEISTKQKATFVKGVTFNDTITMSGTGTLDVQKKATFSQDVTFSGTVDVPSKIVAGVNLGTLSSNVLDLQNKAGAGSFGTGSITTTGLVSGGEGKFTSLNAGSGLVSTTGKGTFGSIDGGVGKFTSLDATSGLVSTTGEGKFGSVTTTGTGSFKSLKSLQPLDALIIDSKVSIQGDTNVQTLFANQDSSLSTLTTRGLIKAEQGITSNKGMMITNGKTGTGSNNWQIRESEGGMLCFLKLGSNVPIACIESTPTGGNLVAGVGQTFASW